MSYRVAITADVFTADGTEVFPGSGLIGADAPNTEFVVLDELLPEVTGAQLAGFDALVLAGSAAVTERTLEDAPQLRHVARFGSGYDAVDVDACTRHGVQVTNTPEAVREPMALAGLTMLLAVSHNLVQKDAITRAGRWGERSALQGPGVTGSTVGIIGFGGIGKATAELVRGVGAEVLVQNRSDRSAEAIAIGARQVSLDELLAASDYVMITVAYTADTHHLIGADQLARMPRHARLINMARGKVVDEAALIEALRSGTISGAGLDVFANEPVEPDNPLLTMQNVTVTPHALCWTDSFARRVGHSVLTAIADVAAGRRPQHLINPAAVGAGIR